MFTYLAVTQETTRVLYSSTGCCSITVDDIDITSDDVLVYEVSYTTYDGLSEITFVQQPELEAEINMYQEYCYHNH